MKRPLLEISLQRARLSYLAERQRRTLADAARWLAAPLVILGAALEIGKVVRLRLLDPGRRGRLLLGAAKKGGWPGKALRVLALAYRAFSRLAGG